jgi:hypothetical protein
MLGSQRARARQTSFMQLEAKAWISSSEARANGLKQYKIKWKQVTLAFFGSTSQLAEAVC